MHIFLFFLYGVAVSFVYLDAMHLFSKPEMTRQIKISLKPSSKELSHPSANAHPKAPL